MRRLSPTKSKRKAEKGARFVEVQLVAESDFKVARVLDLPIFRSLWCDSP